MRLFWITYLKSDRKVVIIEPASALSYARLSVEHGNDLVFQEGRELDRAMAKRVPKTMIGRMLEVEEAESLLLRIR